MLFPAEQAFVGRDEKRAPLKTPAWEAKSKLAKIAVKGSVDNLSFPSVLLESRRMKLEIRAKKPDALAG